MSQKIYVGFNLQTLCSFLSLRESLCPTIIRRLTTRICVGITPWEIYPYGFCRFIIVTVWIWDPGKSNLTLMNYRSVVTFLLLTNKGGEAFGSFQRCHYKQCICRFSFAIEIFATAYKFAHMTNLLFMDILDVSECFSITIALFYWIVEDIGSVIREKTLVGTSLGQGVRLPFMILVLTECMVDISVCKGNLLAIVRDPISQNIETHKREYRVFRRCAFQRLPLSTQVLHEQVKFLISSILLGSFSCKISMIQRYDMLERSWYGSFGTIVST